MSELTPDLRAKYLQLVDRQFGIKESDYGVARMDEAVARLLPVTPCATAQELLGKLTDGEHTGWLDELVNHLTVGETYFLRDPAAVSALRRVVLPEILERRAPERRVRVWSAGCSTGEEAYTLAILLQEQAILNGWDIAITGTDVNRDSLRTAREGRYPSWSFRGTSDAFRQRYFEPVGNSWRLIEAVRRTVLFGWTNLAADPLTPPSADFDLIMCRNVTIYFDDRATQRLYKALIDALAPGGWLMLGPSDPLPTERSLLERIEDQGAVLWRRASARPHIMAQRPLTRPRLQAVPRPVRKVNVAVAPLPLSEVPGNGRAELEAGLLALEAGSPTSALEWLRRATFRDPHSPLGQFALARAYLEVGDQQRAHAALLHSQRLLATLRTEAVVLDSDMSVEALRQAVRAHLSGMEAANA